MVTLNIALVSDFFYPNVGGVESHIYHLSQNLVHLGHKVVIITHQYGKDRIGVRHIVNGVKVYYIPNFVVYNQASIITVIGLFPVFRNIFIREQIQLVHAHQAFATFALEALFHAATMRIATCFTDHSLFGFRDTSSILFNKFLKFSISSDCLNIICVSHAGKENTVLRANVKPEMVSVVPNAVVSNHFKPDFKEKLNNEFTTIVVVSRLVYRKGIDLLVAVIPRLCRQHKDLKFVIGGDGPKRVDLEQMRERNILSTQVELLGAIENDKVRGVLNKGDIFLNTSLTEAFCMGVIEAASCGLEVVTTKVGGIVEILPQEMLNFAKPDDEDLVRVINKTIEKVRLKKPNKIEYEKEAMIKHERISKMYSWLDITIRTEKIYREIYKKNEKNRKLTNLENLKERLERHYHNNKGMVSGKIACMFVIVDYLILLILNLIFPQSQIEKIPKFNIAIYKTLGRES